MDTDTTTKLLTTLATLEERSKHAAIDLADIKDEVSRLPREDTVRITVARGIKEHVESCHKKAGDSKDLALKLGIAAVGVVGTSLAIILSLV